MARSHGISAIRFVKARGFSLLELMVALAILAIVARVFIRAVAMLRFSCMDWNGVRWATG